MIQAVANTLQISFPEARFFIALFTIFPLTAFYQLLPCSQKSPNYQQQILIRKIYGLIFGILLLSYIYTWDQIIATLIVFVTSYLGALRCKTNRQTILWNLMNFIILTLAHLYRVIFYFNQDVYNINFILMMAIPRQMYFNYWVLNIYKIKEKPDQKNTLIQVKEDEQILGNEIPSFFNYICYMFNFIGNFTTPLYTYQEYKHFIYRSFDNKKKNHYFGISKLAYFIFFAMVYILQGKLLSDRKIIYSKNFQTQAFWYQLYVLMINSFIIRSRYYVGFLMGDINSYLGNLRDSASQYDQHIECIDIFTIETNVSPKKRIPAWNVTTAKWLRYAIYEPIKQEFNLSTNKASLLTFAISAFWHGLQPNYYLGFFIINITTQIEKFVYRKKIKYFPSFIFYLIFDIGCTIFKTLDFVYVWKFICNVWIYLFILFILYFITRYVPRSMFREKTDIVNKKREQQINCKQQQYQNQPNKFEKNPFTESYALSNIFLSYSSDNYNSYKLVYSHQPLLQQQFISQILHVPYLFTYKQFYDLLYSLTHSAIPL